jgi:hypothetical protein
VRRGRARVTLSWVMIATSVLIGVPSTVWLAERHSDRVIILLGVLGLVFPAVGNLWQAEQMED